MPNSIYHNINYESAFDVIKKVDGKFFIIGLPCQLTGIELLLSKKKHASLKEKVYLKVALICGYTFDRVNMEFFSQMNDFNMKEITYRENGRYRKTRISNAAKSLKFDIKNPQSINERINNNMMFDKWMPQKHCLYCVDHLGYTADIVVGDAWQNRYKEDKIGTNIIIARTSLGNKVIKDIEEYEFENGMLTELIESQHDYAEPFLGLSMAKENVFKDDFIPEHRVSIASQYNKRVKFSIKDKVKISYIKQLFRKRYFNVAKFLYILLELKLVLKLVIKKMIGRKI